MTGSDLSAPGSKQHLAAFQETPISSTEDQARDLTLRETKLPNRLDSKLGQVSCV